MADFCQSKQARQGNGLIAPQHGVMSRNHPHRSLRELTATLSILVLYRSGRSRAFSNDLWTKIREGVLILRMN